MVTVGVLFEGISSTMESIRGAALQQTKYDEVVTTVAVLLSGLAYVTRGSLWDREDPYRYKLFEKPKQRAGAFGMVQRIDNLGQRLEAEGCDIAILWASQSGTAERLAGRLAKELRRVFGAKVLPLDISDIAPGSLTDVPSSKIVIFVASTFGEGDPSDNLHQLWSWLQANRETRLSNLRFLAFGLGNSKYKHYNHVVDVLVNKLLAREAQMLMSTGKADDAAGETEEHFIEWKHRVFDLFQAHLHYERRDAQYEPSITVAEDTSLLPKDLWSGTPYTFKAQAMQSKVFPLSITRSHDLLRDSLDRTCIHMDIDISGNSILKYKTGDHLCIWPVNPDQEVELLLRTLGLNGKRATPVRIQSMDGSTVKLPSPTTLEAAFQAYLEICAPVAREGVHALMPYAPTKAARDLLETITNDKASYAEYAKSKYLNLGRLLTSACSKPGAWSSVPLSLVLEMLPTMQPRYYSISSSSVVCPRQVSITVAVSDTTDVGSEDRVIGLATNYLSSAKDGHHPHGLTYSSIVSAGHVFAAVRKSAFKLPTVSSAPIVMVGAGTGVAPFRAFVQERARLKSVGRMVGPTRLYFGCRNDTQDSLYTDDFSRWADELGDCFAMATAFSRPNSGVDKRYVQDTVMEDRQAVCRLLIDENAYFYICGSAAMARDLSATVEKIIMTRQNWTEGEMRDFADRQKRQRRWLQDVWG